VGIKWKMSAPLAVVLLGLPEHYFIQSLQNAYCAYIMETSSYKIFLSA
jgi:hypothetical protein